MADHTITIDMDKKCAECRKGGACQNGLCLSCSTKAMDPKRAMKSPEGRAVQERFKEIFAKRRSA